MTDKKAILIGDLKPHSRWQGSIREQSLVYSVGGITLSAKHLLETSLENNR